MVNIGFNVDSLQEVIDFIIKWGPLLLPLVIIQFGLLIFAALDIAKKKKTKNFNPIIWVLIVCLVNMIGPILYFVFGRSDEDNSVNGDDDI